MAWYLDTSAFLKLIVVEDHSEAMRRWYAVHGPAWSCQLLVTEAQRAASRLGVAPRLVDEALEAVNVVLPSVGTYRAAGMLPVNTLRSLDALHVAAALELGHDLEAIVTYDERMTAAAASIPVVVRTPT